MKKYSWIVALMIALTVIFIGCGADPILPSDDDEVLTDVELGDFNAWGGQKANQSGWAPDDFKFKGGTDNSTTDIPQTAKSMGYKEEDFLKAKYLVLTLKKDWPANAITICWGAEDGNALGLSGWNETKLSSDAGDPNPGSGLVMSDDKMTATIELSKALSNYKGYLAAEGRVRLLVNYYAGVSKFIDSAKLQISSKSAPFVPITDLALEKDNFPWTGELKLAAKFTPEDASKQVVTWSIKSWKATSSSTPLVITGKPTGTDAEKTSYNTSKAALLAKVDFKKVSKEVTDAIFYTDTSVDPPDEIKVQDAGTVEVKSSDTIIAMGADKSQSVGIVTLVATVKGGGADGKDYTKEVTVNIKEVYIKSFIVSDTSAGKSTTSSITTFAPGNVTVSGGTVTSSFGGYILMAAAGSGWEQPGPGPSNYAYFQITLPSGKKLSDYASIGFSVVAVADGDRYKDIGIFASASAPTTDMNTAGDNGWVRLGKGAIDSNGNALDARYNGYDTQNWANNLVVDFKDGITGAVDIQNPYIVIFINAPKGSGYRVWDIVLIPK
jgi:hypothetical protein